MSTTTPAVYVGTYHKYNCGSIFGKPSDGAEAVREVVREEGHTKDTGSQAVTLPEHSGARDRDEAVAKVVHDNVLRERLQQTERDMVRDLAREKTPGGD